MLRHHLLLPLMALLLFAPAVDAQEWTPELAMQVKRVGAVVPSPDGQLVVYQIGSAIMDEETSEWRTHIHLARADGSESRQLTRGETSATSPAWSPDGRWIAFLSSRTEKRNIWRIPVDGGEAEQVTDVTGSVGSYRWSPDGTRVAFTMTDPQTDEEAARIREHDDAQVVDGDIKMSRLYVADVGAELEGRSGRAITEGTMSVAAGGFDWSPNGRAIVFAHSPSPKANDGYTRSDLAIVDVQTGDVSDLATSGARESGPRYSRDGRWIAFNKSDDPVTWAFMSDVHVIAPDGTGERALGSTFDRQPTIVGWAADDRSILVSEARGTISQLSSVPVDGGAPRDVSSADMMVSGATLNVSGSHFGFVSQSPSDPPEAFVSATGSLSPVQVSHAQTIPAVPMGRSEVVRWTSDDGMAVEGLLTYPVGYRAGEPVPMVVIVHGGPTGVFTQSFIGSAGSYPIAAFTGHGYAVLRANPRGSSGYGKDFRYANYGDWGGGDYQDIMTGVDAMIDRGVADPDRLGVMGWSYGGYMTSWIITQTDRFKAASVGAGLPNLMSFSGTADVPDFVVDYFGGEFWEVPEAWQAHSALFNIEGVTTPTLIQHGEQDRRVPISQAYELRNALYRQDVDVTMVVYPRQPHGIQEPKLQLDAMHRNLSWFDRWVLGRNPDARLIG
ncbi:MAG: prolyl oligopeptidase family serine peptidase [Proteobacteria bacterium]|nr:prolyl oligopeptidase family serine peptidase [Pseudomonadota bacterium]